MKVGVIGSGTMGHGIAEVSSLTGYDTIIVDVSWEFLNRAKEKVTESLNKLSERGRLRESPDDILRRMKFTTEYADLRDADLVIEAVPEDFNLKREVFKKLDSVTKPATILASNTSSIPISDIAEVTGRREKVIGMHFFNPPVIMKLVEVVPSKYTSAEVSEEIVKISKEMGKTPVKLRVEVPGFVSNRVFLRLLQEACREVEWGEATVEEVDRTARNILKLPMGVFELADYTGIDVINGLWDVIVNRGAYDVPCNIFRRLQAEKKLGVKSGIGFYRYPGPGKFQKPQLEPGGTISPATLLSLAINESCWLVEGKIVKEEEVDTVMKLGFNFPKGLFEFAKEIGYSQVLRELKRISSRGLVAYRPSRYLELLIMKG